MFKYVKNIDHVQVMFQNHRYINQLGKINEPNQYVDKDLPFSMLYNEPWEIFHNCDCSNKRIRFCKEDNFKWFFINRLYSKYSSIELLKVLCGLFKSLKLIELSKSSMIFLTTNDFNENNAPIWKVPQVKLNFYECRACYTTYLCRLSEGMPIEPSKEYPEGLCGTLILREIIQFDSPEGMFFTNFLRDNQKNIR